MCMCENDDFTVLVSAGGRHHWVSMCTVCPLHSNDWVEQWICIKFCIELEHSETIQMIQKAAAMGSWWLAASLWQHACSCFTSYAEFFGKTSNHPGDPAPLLSRFGALQLLASPKTKSIFEREEISDHWWNLGNYNGTDDGDWENCVRSQRAYFEGDWGALSYIQCFLHLVSSPINVSILTTSGQDGGIGRHTVPPHTTKTKTTTI